MKTVPEKKRNKLSGAGQKSLENFVYAVFGRKRIKKYAFTVADLGKAPGPSPLFWVKKKKK